MAFHYWLNQLTELKMLRKPPPAGNPAADNPQGKIAAEQDPPVFWSLHLGGRNVAPPHHPVPQADPMPKASDEMQASVTVAEPFGSNLSQNLLKAIFEEVRASGIPTLIYLAPVNGEIRDYGYLYARYLDMGDALKSYVEAGDGERICIYTGYPDSLISQIQFGDDAIHIRRSEPLASHFAQILENFYKTRTCPE
jgi:hypothetical protein